MTPKVCEACNNDVMIYKKRLGTGTVATLYATKYATRFFNYARSFHDYCNECDFTKQGFLIDV